MIVKVETTFIVDNKIVYLSNDNLERLVAINICFSSNLKKYIVLYEAVCLDGVTRKFFVSIKDFENKFKIAFDTSHYLKDCFKEYIAYNASKNSNNN